MLSHFPSRCQWEIDSDDTLCSNTVSPLDLPWHLLATHKCTATFAISAVTTFNFHRQTADRNAWNSASHQTGAMRPRPYITPIEDEFSCETSWWILTWWIRWIPTLHLMHRLTIFKMECNADVSMCLSPAKFLMLTDTMTWHFWKYKLWYNLKKSVK